MDKLARSYVWHRLVLAKLRVELEECRDVLEQRKTKFIEGK